MNRANYLNFTTVRETNKQHLWCSNFSETTIACLPFPPPRTVIKRKKTHINSTKKHNYRWRANLKKITANLRSEIIPANKNLMSFNKRKNNHPG